MDNCFTNVDWTEDLLGVEATLVGTLEGVMHAYSIDHSSLARILYHGWIAIGNVK